MLAKLVGQPECLTLHPELEAKRFAKFALWRPRLQLEQVTQMPSGLGWLAGHPLGEEHALGHVQPAKRPRLAIGRKISIS